jgi:hypothetical protein
MISTVYYMIIPLTKGNGLGNMFLHGRKHYFRLGF